MTKIFKKDHYHKVFGVDKEYDPSKEEKAAKDYSDHKNRDDDYWPWDVSLMQASFLAGILWQKNNSRQKK